MREDAANRKHQRPHLIPFNIGDQAVAIGQSEFTSVFLELRDNLGSRWRRRAPQKQAAERGQRVAVRVTNRKAADGRAMRQSFYVEDERNCMNNDDCGAVVWVTLSRKDRAGGLTGHPLCFTGLLSRADPPIARSNY